MESSFIVEAEEKIEDLRAEIKDLKETKKKRLPQKIKSKIINLYAEINKIKKKIKDHPKALRLYDEAVNKGLFRAEKDYIDLDPAVLRSKVKRATMEREAREKGIYDKLKRTKSSKEVKKYLNKPTDKDEILDFELTNLIETGFDFDSDQGFVLVNTKTIKKFSITYNTYISSDNQLMTVTFLAARHFVAKILEEDPKRMISLVFLISSRAGVNEAYTFSQDILKKFLAISSIEQMNRFLNNFNNDTSGSDAEVSSYIFDPTTFKIGYSIPQQGGALFYTTDKKCTLGKINNVNGFLCYTPKQMTKDNNCLIECFRYAVNGRWKSSKVIRSELLFPKGATMLSIEYIPQLEVYFGVKILVMTGRNTYGNFNVIYPKIDFETIEEYNDKVKVLAETVNFAIMFNNNHFSLVKSCVDTFIESVTASAALSKEKSNFHRSDLPYRYLFFDYETIYDENGWLEPYSIAMTVMNDKFEVLEEFFYAENPFTSDVRLNSKFNEVIQKYNTPDHRNIMVSYNGARFDNFILARKLTECGVLKGKNIMIANRTILSMKFDNIRVMDLCKFVMLPLKAACEGFKCKGQKTLLEHKDVQKKFFNNEFDDWLQKSNNELKDYNVNDCNVLAELYEKVKVAFKQQAGRDIEDFCTISQLCYDKFLETVKGKFDITPPKEHYVKPIRGSYVAGRAQAWRTGFFANLGIVSLDVKSLYPFVMENCIYPYGEEIETDVYRPDKLGIYFFVKISKQPKTKIIPIRKKFNLDWAYEGTIIRSLTSIDIEMLKEYGADVKILSRKVNGSSKPIAGVYWEKSDYIFENYVKPLREEKTRQDNLKNAKSSEYNPALREVIKLMLNSLSGKVGQREYKNDTEFCFSQNQIESFFKSHKNISFDIISEFGAIKLEGSKKNYKYSLKKAKPCHLAAFIYSYARSHMYKAILSKVDKKFFTDTDSCHISRADWEKLLADNKRENKLALREKFGKFQMGGDFGDFENEINFNVERYYVVAPKCYAMFGEGKEKIRFKGINMNQDKIYSIIHDIKKFRQVLAKKEGFNALNTKDRFAKFLKYEKAASEELYKLLTSGKNVAIVASVLKRSTGKKVASLQQVFTVKTIHHTGVVIN